MSEGKHRPLDLEEILRECEYEWDEKAEEYIQKQFEHWIDCYYPEVMIPENKQDVVIVPLSIRHDFWRDVFTDVVKTVKGRLQKVLIQRIKSACEFYLRYKDNPELFSKNVFKIKWEFYSDVGHLIWNTDKNRWENYNEWLFRLTFKSVL